MEQIFKPQTESISKNRVGSNHYICWLHVNFRNLIHSKYRVTLADLELKMVLSRIMVKSFQHLTGIMIPSQMVTVLYRIPVPGGIGLADNQILMERGSS